MRLEDLPPLGEALTLAGVRAQRRLGQHFLFDLNVCRRIAALAGPLAGRLVIEVGPGPGGLTRVLLEAGARVIAVEKDARFLPVLAHLAAVADGGLSVVNADALTVDQRALAGRDAADAVVVANLPYNVGSVLLAGWLVGPFRPRQLTLMFQKELAARIVAPPGGRDYGRLSVLVQALCEAKILLNLPARVFTPPPKVDSSVVGLVARTPRPPDRLIGALQTLTREAFGQRRKMLRSSLRALGGERLCARTGIDPALRAQNVTVEGYLKLAAASLEASA